MSVTTEQEVLHLHKRSASRDRHGTIKGIVVG